MKLFLVSAHHRAFKLKRFLRAFIAYRSLEIKIPTDVLNVGRLLFGKHSIRAIA